jgi:hypothetical protein
MTSVRVNLEYVRNLGNYESVRVSLGVEDSLRNNETTNAAFERVYAFVENKLHEKVNEITEELNEKEKKHKR